MAKIGEYPIQRSDGNWDNIDIHAQGTFDFEPVLIQLSDGRWGAPNLQPVGEGDTGLLVQASDGNWYQVSEQAISVIEDWESGTFNNWGATNEVQLTTTETFEGTYALEASTSNNDQKVYDTQQNHNNLPRYQTVGDTARIYGYFDEIPDTSQGSTFLRWGFGGVWGDSSNPAYYAHWNINDQGLHIINSDGHNTLASGYSFSYGGHEWWGLETEWQSSEVFVRLINYADPNNTTVEEEISTTDVAALDSTDGTLGHYWYVWNNSVYNLYSDYAIITSD